MLFERRAYTLRPGCEETFWQLQRKWNTPKTYRPMLERNFGYFAITAGSAERIIHLYRWDDYEDGKRRIAAIATPERAEYFAAARDLMLAQGSILLDRSPIAELNPLWSGDRDWLPGELAFGGIADLNALAVSESVLDFLPGGLAAYWEEYRKLDAATMELVRRGLVGVFFVTTGPLHRAIHYHWHRSWPDWKSTIGLWPKVRRGAPSPTAIDRGSLAARSPISDRARCRGRARCSNPSIGRRIDEAKSQLPAL